VADAGNTYKLSCRNAEKLGYLSLYRRIILKWILILRTGLLCLRIREKKKGSSKHVEKNLRLP